MAGNYQVCSTVHKISHYNCDKVMHQQHLSAVKNCHQLTGCASAQTLSKTTLRQSWHESKSTFFDPTHSVNADSDWPDWRVSNWLTVLQLGSYAKLIPTWSHLHNFTDNIFKLVPNDNWERNWSRVLSNTSSVFFGVMISISKLLSLLSTIVTMISGVCDNSHSFYYSSGQTQQKITSSPTHFLMHNWFLISNSKFVNDTVRICLLGNSTMLSITRILVLHWSCPGSKYEC